MSQSLPTMHTPRQGVGGAGWGSSWQLGKGQGKLGLLPPPPPSSHAGITNVGVHTTHRPPLGKYNGCLSLGQVCITKTPPGRTHTQKGHLQGKDTKVGWWWHGWGCLAQVGKHTHKEQTRSNGIIHTVRLGLGIHSNQPIVNCNLFHRTKTYNNGRSFTPQIGTQNKVTIKAAWVCLPCPGEGGRLGRHNGRRRQGHRHRWLGKAQRRVWLGEGNRPHGLQLHNTGSNGDSSQGMAHSRGWHTESTTGTSKAVGQEACQEGPIMFLLGNQVFCTGNTHTRHRIYPSVCPLGMGILFLHSSHPPAPCLAWGIRVRRWKEGRR